MLQIHTTQRLGYVESALRASAERHGGSVLAVSHTGHLLRGEPGMENFDALTFTLCFSAQYAPMLRADVRFAAFLPARIAVWARGESVFLEAVSPREWARLLHRPELEPLAVPLESVLLLVMEDAAHRPSHAAPEAGYRATEDMVNMGAALPQRIDCHGTKLEELAGTGVHDAQGG
jgi:uncharacterized protein (DUF302 family)